MEKLCLRLIVLVYFSILQVVAHGYGHGPALHIEAVPQRLAEFWVGRVPSHGNIPPHYSSFQSKGGDALVVAPSPEGLDNPVLVKWQEGSVLAFVEGKLEGKTPVFGTTTEGYYFLSPLEYFSINADIMRYAHVVDLELKSGWKARPNVHVKHFVSVPQFPSGFDVDRSYIEQYLKQLSGELPVTLEGVEEWIVDRGYDKPRQILHRFLKAYFESAGFKTRLHCYGPSWRRGCNIEATLVGKNPDKFVLATAHIDSVKNKGADDDGSGTAALMEIARLFVGQTPEYGIRIVGFDQEELGLLGSRAYVKALSSQEKEKIVGVLQADMIAYDSDGDGKIHVMDCNRSDSQFLQDAVLSSVEVRQLELVYSDGCTNRSDHASFWSAGVPAVLISENFFGGDNNHCYHRSCDTVELINWPYYLALAQTFVDTTWALANP